MKLTTNGVIWKNSTGQMTGTNQKVGKTKDGYDGNGLHCGQS